MPNGFGATASQRHRRRIASFGRAGPACQGTASAQVWTSNTGALDGRVVGDSPLDAAPCPPATDATASTTASREAGFVRWAAKPAFVGSAGCRPPAHSRSARWPGTRILVIAVRRIRSWPLPSGRPRSLRSRSKWLLAGQFQGRRHVAGPFDRVTFRGQHHLHHLSP